MKTPISYYGGKQNLVSEILPIIAACPHTQYVEPFVGGAAIFFAKNPSPHEVINDLDGRVTNFYWQMQMNFDELQKMVKATLHSEIHHKRAKEVLRDSNADPVERAWAFWVQCNMSFGKVMMRGFSFDKSGGATLSIANKREAFSIKLAQRIEFTQILQRDAVVLIRQNNDPDTLFYIDPPYVTADQGHYPGYTRENFHNLLSALSKTKAKFILSSYPEPDLMHFRSECGWWFRDITQPIVALRGKRMDKVKTECITTNFDPTRQYRLF